MNALTLLVDAANAESESTTTTSAATAAAGDTKNGKNQKMIAKINSVEKVAGDGSVAASTAAMAQALAASASNRTPGAAVVISGGANNTFAAALAARENAIFQQIQQQQGAAAKNRYLEELCKLEQEHRSKERLAASAIMLQREKEQQHQTIMHQAALLRLMGGGGSQAATSAPVGSVSPQARGAAPATGMRPRQEAEYLQQLRLEALVQQRRQETLAQLALAQEMGYSNAVAPVVPKAVVSKDNASHKYKRQDTALQKAILMARADEELRKHQLEQRELEQQREQEQEQHKQHQQHAMILQLMTNGDHNGAFMTALRTAATPTGASLSTHPGNGSSKENTILQLLEERERQRLIAQHHHQNQQSQHQTFLPQGVTSSSALSSVPSASPMQLKLQQQLQQHLQAQQQQQEQHHGGNQGERSDLIGSVFAKVAAATASASDKMNHNSAQQQPIPSQVLSAIAAAEEQDKQKLLQLQHHHQNSQESFQSSGMMMDALSHSQQQRQRLQQQALVHNHQQQQQQQQAAALTQQRQESIHLNREMQQQQQQQSVERDVSFHDSKSTILPCRARGMPMDHNIKTAYFVIPDDIKHGTELLCSYFACRNAGIKFRYCVYCKLPVAKRNFAKRHRHSGKIPDSDVAKDVVAGNVTDISPDDEPTSSSARASPQQIQQLQKAQQEQQTLQDKDPSGDAPVDPPTKEESSLAPLLVATLVLSSESNDTTKDPSEKAVSPSCGDNCETPSCCAANCEEAPTHEAGPSKPMQDSKGKKSESIDPNTPNDSFPTREPSPAGLSPEPIVDTSKRRKAWGNLLLKRPKTERRNSDVMLAWIREVLHVSDLETEVDSDGSGIDDNESDVQIDTDSTLNGGTKRKIEEMRPLSPKISKTKALLSRKEQEEIDQSEYSDESNTESGKQQHDDEDISREDLVDNVPGKGDEDFPDDASTSSEESVDLRVRKKSRN